MPCNHSSDWHGLYGRTFNCSGVDRARGHRPFRDQRHADHPGLFREQSSSPPAFVSLHTVLNNRPQPVLGPDLPLPPRRVVQKHAAAIVNAGSQPR